MTSLLNVIFFLTISIQANSFSLDLKSDRDFSNQLLHGEHFFILKDKIAHLSKLVLISKILKIVVLEFLKLFVLLNPLQKVKPVKNAYHTKPNLPLIQTQGSNQDLLYFIFSHEFGHVFDFANNLNQTI